MLIYNLKKCKNGWIIQRSKANFENHQFVFASFENALSFLKADEEKHRKTQ